MPENGREQLVACPVGEERVERRPELCQRRVQGELDVELADLGVAEDGLERLGVAAGTAQRRKASVLVLAGGDDEGTALLGHYAIPGLGRRRRVTRHPVADHEPLVILGETAQLERVAADQSVAVRFGERAAQPG